MRKKSTARKIAAIVLSIIMVAELLPATIFAQAEDNPVKPFYVVNWEYENTDWDGNKALTAMNYDAFDYVDYMPYTYIKASNIDNKDASTINISVFFDDDTSSSNVNTAAQKLYAEFSSRPAGTRYLNLAAMTTVFEHCAEAVIDMRKGVELVNGWLTRFLAAYKAIGGELDGIAIDLEYNNATAFYLNEQYKTNKNVYHEIVENQYYQTYIRPQLVQMKDFTFSTGTNSELWSINTFDSKSASAWNQVIQKVLADYITEAVFQPLMTYYPNAVMSDYSSADSASWYKGMSNQGKQSGYTAVKAGNASSERFYGAGFSEYFFDGDSTAADPRTDYHKPAGHYEAVFNPETAYTRALYDINTHKRHLASTVDATPDNPNDNKVTAWISYFNFASSTGYRNSPYYSEMIYHLGMTNPEVFQGYVMLQDVRNTSIAPQDYLSVLNDLMTELTRVAGAADREPIQTPISWNEGYVLSGMYAGGRNIWRLTPNTDRVGLEEFLVKDTTHPTFSANGLTITFPQGRIIEDGPVGYVGTCGYWIETPEDVTPVVTSSANRYAENPSFQETFDRYKTGIFTTIEGSLSTSMRHPDTYWTASGTKAEIKEINSNKVIALSGTTTLTNSKTPAKITAGDYSAKQQAWEVTFTLPADGKYGTINLLRATTNDGLKIANGIVSYYNSSSTATTISGVKLQAGETYTAKREVDFATKQNSYYIYDANGTKVGSVTNQAMKLTSASSISMSTTSATSVVLLDDYKLYPLGVTATLDIYETVRGRSLATNCTSDTTARSEKIAYRLSWMNASGEYKKAVVYNKETNQPIREVLMAPGMDGYITGFVDADAANQVLLAVRQEAVSAPEQPTYENNFNWDGLAENLGITCIVGNQGYAKLEDALANAKDGQAVILLTDAQLASTAVISRSVKILANGKTISLKDGFSGDCAIKIAAGGQLTWDEGMTINAGNKTALCVSGGTLTVQGGQITAQTGIAVTGGNLTVTGGNITATDTAILLCQDADKTPASVSVTGGILGGKKALYHCNTNDTPSKYVTAIISGATYTGTVETSEAHFVFKTDETGLYLHGHTVVIDAAVTPSCGVTGLTEGIHCSTCGDILKAQETVADLGEHNWTDSNCTAAKTCSKCGATEGVPLGHNYETISSENNVDTRKCTRCSDTIIVGTTASLKITYGTSATGGTFEPTLKENMSPVYKNTTAAGLITDGSESNWNIKVEWALNGTPTMTLRNATIKNDRLDTSSHLLEISGTADFVIKLEGENKAIIDQAICDANGKTGTQRQYAGGNALRAANSGSLTITSDIDGDGDNDGGTLLMESYAAHTLAKGFGALIFENANITVNMQHRPTDQSGVSLFCTVVLYYASSTSAKAADLTDFIIDGGKVDLYNKGQESVIRLQKTVSGSVSTDNKSDIDIKNGAKVTIHRTASGAGDNKFTIRFGSNSKFYIRNSDVDMTNAGRYCFAYAPYLEGNFTVETPANYTHEGGFPIYNSSPYKDNSHKLGFPSFKVVHNCQEGVPVVERSEYTCSPKYSVTYCTVCGKELKRKLVSTGDKVHTLGNKEFKIITTPDGTNEGKYKVTYTCSICNESWTDEETFYPAIFYYKGNAEDTVTLANCWSTTGNITPKHIMQPGSDPIYFVTTAGDNSEYYVSATGNADNWTMKLEYPLGGTPVLTLKGATIVNETGLWYGVGKYTKTAPLKIVVEKDSRIAHATDSLSGILNFHTTADVTITGSGQLTIESRTNNSNTATIRSKGNLILDNANIEFFKHETTSYGNLIDAAGGDITIDGGRLYMLAFGNKKRGFYHGISARSENGSGGNLTIRNGANVTVAGTAYADFYGLLRATKDVTISESTVELAHGYAIVDGKTGVSAYGDAIFCGGNFNVNYANGFTASYADTRTTYDTATGVLTVPTTVTTVTTRDRLSPAVRGRYYLKIQPAKTLAKFEGARIIVANNLDLEFALDTSKVANTGYALITRSRVNANGDIVYDAPIRVDLKDVNQEIAKGVNCYVIPYTGIAAKEMRDTVTIVVYDEHGNIVTETKTDSIYDYAMRTLRGSAPADCTDPTQFEKLKKVLVDMLNYGTMAQIQFYHNNSNLANTNLSPNEWQSYATKDADMEQCFDIKPTQTPQPGVTATRHLGTTFSLTSSIAMKMAIDTTDLHEGSYALVYMDGKSTRVDAVDYNGYAIYTYKGMVPKNGRKDIKWEFYTAGGELKLTVTDSLANYVGRMVNQHPYLKNLMKYCDAAANYFPSEH